LPFFNEYFENHLEASGLAQVILPIEEKH